MPALKAGAVRGDFTRAEASEGPVWAGKAYSWRHRAGSVRVELQETQSPRQGQVNFPRAQSKGKAQKSPLMLLQGGVEQGQEPL